MSRKSKYQQDDRITSDEWLALLALAAVIGCIALAIIAQQLQQF